MSGLEMRYFVLKPGGTSIHSVASRNALLEYADAIESDEPGMAQDLRDWVAREYEAARNVSNKDHGIGKSAQERYQV